MKTKRQLSREKRKTQILSYLKKFGRSATSKISIFIGLPSNYTIKILDELVEDKKIIKEIETNAIYWKLYLQSPAGLE